VRDDTQPIGHGYRCDLKVSFADDKPFSFKSCPDQAVIFGGRFVKRMNLNMRADAINFCSALFLFDGRFINAI
jgi:hypothetical protein